MAPHLNRLLLVPILSASLAGCAIHPLPQDVTGYDTYEIVAKIRCEAREAVQDKAIALMGASTDARMNELARELAVDRSKFKKFSSLPLSPAVKFFADKYAKTAIAYEFTFDITEDNADTGQIDFLSAVTHGAVKVGVNASDERSRQNVRHFQVSDTFGKLVGAEIFCPQSGKGPNWVYPIAGRINIAEPIKQFIDLNEFQNLATLKDGKVPTLTDQLTFQTTLSGSVNPQLTLSPAQHGVLDASLNTSAKRIDKHMVILGFSLPASTLSSAPFVSTSPVVTPFGLLGIPAGAAKSPAELNALAAIQEAKLTQFLQRGNLFVSP